MNFSISKSPAGVPVVSLCGELDVTTVAEVRHALDELLRRRLPRVEVDLNHLRMIDSIGMGTLVAFYKRTHEHGGEVALRELHGQPLAIFRLVHLDRILMQT